MKASKLQTWWIMLQSGLAMSRTCISAIFHAAVGKATRQYADDLAQRWSKRILAIPRIRYSVHNPHNVVFEKKHPYIVMCNHSSLYDIPLAFIALPHCSLRMLAKKELSKIPIFGRAMKATGIPLIDRHNRKQAIKDLEHVRKLMLDGIVIWIAPEGTRSQTGKLGSFKKGGFITAIKSQATIVPIGIRGAEKILPAKTFQFHLDQKAEIHIGEPIDAAHYTLANKEALMEKVRNEMLALVGEPA